MVDSERDWRICEIKGNDFLRARSKREHLFEHYFCLLEEIDGKGEQGIISYNRKREKCLANGASNALCAAINIELVSPWQTCIDCALFLTNFILLDRSLSCKTFFEYFRTLPFPLLTLKRTP